MSASLLLCVLSAQAAARPPRLDAGKAAWTLGLLVVVLLAALLLAGIAVFVARNKALRRDSAQADIPLTLAEIRRMRGSGQIDDDEMKRLKGIVAAQTRTRLMNADPEKQKQE